MFAIDHIISPGIFDQKNHLTNMAIKANDVRWFKRKD